jgi:hypothetical protein
MPGDRTEPFKNHKTGNVSGKPEIMGPLFLKSLFSIACHFSLHPFNITDILSKFVYILAERSSLPLATKLALCGINCIQKESMVSM